MSISNELNEKDHVLDKITEYQKLIGKLIHLTYTRPDISYAVHCLSQFMHTPLKSHLKISLKVLRYLKGSHGKGVHIVKCPKVSLETFVDADWANILCVIKLLVELNTPKVASNSAAAPRVAATQLGKSKRKRLGKQSDTPPAKQLRKDHPSSASGTGGKTLPRLSNSARENVALCYIVCINSWYVPRWEQYHDSLLDDGFFAARTLVDRVPHPGFFSTLRSMDYEQLYTEFNVGAARQICLESKVRSHAEHELKLKEKLKGKYDARGRLLEEKDLEILRLKSLLVEEAKKAKRAETTKVVRLRGQVFALTGEVSVLKSTITQKDTDISLLDSRATYLKFALDDSKAACAEAGSLITSLTSEMDRLTSEDFKEKAEARQEEQAQVLYNRVAELEAHVMDVSGRLEGEFYPAYLTTLAGRRWFLTHGIQLAVLKCFKSPEYQGILGHTLGHAMDFGMHEGLEAGYEHGVAETPLSTVEAYNPEAARTSYFDAVRALEDVDFPLVNLLKSKKDVRMDEVLDCFILDGSLADLPKDAHLQPCLEQLTVPIHHSDDKAIAGETSLSFALLLKKKWVFILMLKEQRTCRSPSPAYMEIDSNTFVFSDLVQVLLPSIHSIVSLSVLLAIGPERWHAYFRWDDSFPLRCAFIKPALASFYLPEVFPFSSTSTCLLRYAKLVDAILLRASAFLFLLQWVDLLLDNCDFSEILFIRFLLALSKANTSFSPWEKLFFCPPEVPIEVTLFCANFQGGIASSDNSSDVSTMFVGRPRHNLLAFQAKTVPPSTENFSIPCAVGGMAQIFLIPGLPIILLCWDGDLTTMKFIHAEVECPSSPIFTSKDIWPNGQMVSPLNPVRYVVGGTIWLLISGRSLTKQCSYKISADAPPSTYIRCTKCPPILASMIIGPSIPSSSPRGGKDIVVSGEKLWVTFCLATFSHV
ncbi:hypothetical protein Tco_0651491 [Tanacetum coccineum]|uniref:Uncharacterized protein n=1 Tax=Tanacetum coccineum TaxID=301880 RepID=A0ABQ4WV25_9ASTR